jgi:1-deoxy-D-xylulose-5-phosphate synthase
MAALDERLIGVTPAMREGSGLVRFAREYPARYFDVGIAEQHAVTFAAGLACEGYKPVLAIYSTFLQRGYDQLIHDVQIQNLPVVFAIDRAGLVGADGATHNGSFDLTYLRCLPGMTVMVPSDENECRQMLYTAFQMNAPAAVRYPRGTGPGARIEQAMTALPLGKGEICRRGGGAAAGAKRVALLAFGAMVRPALDAGEVLDATVANMRFVKPLDDALVLELAGSHDLLVTLEENVIMGGAGSAVLEALERAGRAIPVLQLGLPDRFIDQGDPAIQLASVGLDKDGIVKSIRERLGR